MCHAGVGLGLGHLTRCLVVAQELKATLGAKVNFLIQGDFLERGDLSEFHHRFISRSEDLLSHVSAETPLELLILDLHPACIPNRLESRLLEFKKSNTKIVSIDGLLAYRELLDLIFVPSFQVNDSLKGSRDASVVYGWDCYLIPELERKHLWAPGNKVLVLTGGSDATNLGKAWPSVLNEMLPSETEVHWVRGPFSKQPVLPSSSSVQFIVHDAPAALGPLMQSVNYAVTVFGVSFFELLHHGVPTVTFSPYGGKDELELQQIKALGIALVAADEREATGRLVELMLNAEQAREISSRTYRTLKTSGSKRFVSEVKALFAK